MRRLIFVLILGCATGASAQTLRGDRLYLNTGPCTLSSGSGSPEAARVGKPCDTYIDTTSGTLWEKWTGTGNTGWNVGHNANERVNGNIVLTGSVGLPTFVSQLTGWRVDNLGAADFRYVYADEMHVKSFIADLEQALAGGQIISKSVTTLATTFTCPSASGTATLTVDDLPGAPALQVFQINDWVAIRNFSRSTGGLDVSDCVGMVSTPQTPPGGQQTWTFTRGAPGSSGAMTGGATIAPKTLVLDYGIAGNGYYEVNAIDGIFSANSPYAQTVVLGGNGAPVAANKQLRTRLGNLRGITGVTGEYGLYVYGPAPIGGETQSAIRASSTVLQLINTDVQLFSGATETIRLNHAVPSLAIGAAIPGAYNAGTGIWMGRDAADGLYKFRVGDPAGNRMTWNGTTLQVVGDGGGVTNINGANIQTGSISASRLTIGSGLNMIRNSDCPASVDEWGSFTNTLLPVVQGYALPGFMLNGVSNTCWFGFSLAPGNGTFSEVFTSETYPVVAGNRYEASAYLGVNRTGLTNVSIQWLSASGQVGQSFGNNCTNSFAGGAQLSVYCRSVSIANAPAGAVQARLIIGTNHTGETNPFVFYVHNFFGEALANQTEASPWGPAGITEITGGVIRTRTIFADKIATGTLTANEIAANTITGNNIQGNSISAGHLQAGSVDASKIVAGSITGDRIVAGTITADKIQTNTIVSLGAVTAGSFNLGNGNFVVDAAGNLTSGRLDATGGLIIHGFVDVINSGPGNKFMCINAGDHMFLSTSPCN